MMHNYVFLTFLGWNFLQKSNSSFVFVTVKPAMALAFLSQRREFRAAAIMVRRDKPSWPWQNEHEISGGNLSKSCLSNKPSFCCNQSINVTFISAGHPL